MLEGEAGAEVAEHLLEALSPRVLIALLNLHWQKQLAARRLRKGRSRRDIHIMCVCARVSICSPASYMYTYSLQLGGQAGALPVAVMHVHMHAHVYILYMTTSPA